MPVAARQIATGEAHLAHRIDNRARVEALDVDMFDSLGQQLCLALRVDLGRIHSRVSKNSGFIPAKAVNQRANAMGCRLRRNEKMQGERYSFTTFDESVASVSSM
jgi:hypothetical protein